MCEICESPVPFLSFLMSRAEQRRQRDRERKEAFHVAKAEDRPSDPKRPFQEERVDSVLCYASGRDGRYAGYSGRPSGMIEQGADPEQLERRRQRVRGAGLNERNRADRLGLPGLGEAANRPYCHCAEAAALNIAVSRGESVGDLVFASFRARGMIMKKHPTVLFLPCPNCTSWLNRLSAGYFTEKESPTAVAWGKYLGVSLGKAEQGDDQTYATRRNSISFAINPPRGFRDTPFSIDAFNYIYRCFRL